MPDYQNDTIIGAEGTAYHPIICCNLIRRGIVLSELVLRTRRCRGCLAVFSICRHCDRGHCYCGAACRRAARQRQRRLANRRYQQTDAGRRTHRIRRSEARTTDHGSGRIVRPLSPKITGLSVCAICGGQSRWIEPFGLIPPRRRPKLQRRAARQSSKIYVFPMIDNNDNYLIIRHRSKNYVFR